MTRPVMDPTFWRDRLVEATKKGAVYQSLFVCPPDRWARIETAHRKILAAHVEPGMAVLDSGCGYGRLIALMPEDWQYSNPAYMGVDLSPDFIDRARQLWGDGMYLTFLCHDMRTPIPREWFPATDRGRFDLAILVSVRGMVKRECGSSVWEEVEKNIRAAADHLLFLEYDENDPGSYE